MKNWWNEGPEQNWFFKYKLYHIPFWCLYHYLWWTVAIGNPLKAAANIIFLPYSVKYLFYVVFEALAVYFNLYYLIPRYFDKKRYTLYFLFLTLTITGTALFIVSGYYLSSDLSGKTLKELYGNGSNCFYFFLGYALPSAFASMTLAMTIKLFKNRIQEERRQQMIANEKLETELKFLKHQFNPHFLFNSINSIFILIRKNPELASSALAKFSDLLRHQLYDCNEQQIPLSKEISYLGHFIELEKLRQNKYLKVEFSAEEFYADHLGIAPFLLMTFVENAFKHVSREPEMDNRISIRLSLDQQVLELSVINTIGEAITGAVGGIGLKNVQRRLDLVYPVQHLLSVSQTASLYQVSLQLTLKEMVQLSIPEMTY
ncbi:sensor histidine kinase [Mucilaginibacter sp. OK098]|uniref:sensor histidine kinase n=1 Tax=Mucilaginibacter sp. OK098 TaxID=1855297 RepID=UPI000919893F|nr:histidine kinase [Mucilaginibacter sp. OK098]SHN21241.1 Histidine kinase [Mucilaginibacter sp. OK098]